MKNVEEDGGGHRTGIVPQPPGLNASTRFAFVGTSHEQEVCSLKGLWMCGNIDQACHVFDKMLQRHRNDRFHLHQIQEASATIIETIVFILGFLLLLAVDAESRLPDGIKFSADQVVADSIPVIAEAADSDKTRQLKPDVVEKIDISESLKPLSLSTQDGSQAVNPNQDNQSLQDGIFCQEPEGESYSFRWYYDKPQEYIRSCNYFEHNLFKNVINNQKWILLLPNQQQSVPKRTLKYELHWLLKSQLNYDTKRHRHHVKHSGVSDYYYSLIVIIVSTRY
ncbi:hypothetical protein L1887_07022 [Cichorium endivia]|nr:hypothetical protein L1887_07022 [Cichorium endivia]